jgi:hypothetical protein
MQICNICSHILYVNNSGWLNRQNYEALWAGLARASASRGTAANVAQCGPWPYVDLVKRFMQEEATNPNGNFASVQLLLVGNFLCWVPRPSGARCPLGLTYFCISHSVVYLIIFRSLSKCLYLLHSYILRSCVRIISVIYLHYRFTDAKENIILLTRTRIEFKRIIS